MAGGSLIGETLSCGRPAASHSKEAAGPADYTLTIAVKPVELAPNRIISTTTYNGQFPGPLLRFKEGTPVTIDIHNQTDTPEQLHWHGQFVPTDVDGAAEEGTPFIPAHGSRRIRFVPRPSGLSLLPYPRPRGAESERGTVHAARSVRCISNRRNDPGNYDREVFLTLKEFEPTFSRGGDMAMDFLSPAATVKDLKDSGESAMKASLAKGMPHGFEVGYGSFTINGRMLGSGEPVRVKQGERVLFHVLNGSATEIRSLALPGHTFTVVALDGNPIPKPVAVPGLWLGTAERVSAIVEMNRPGVWILGDMADDDRQHGMGIVVEYAGQSGKPQWVAPKPFPWNYAKFGDPGRAASAAGPGLRHDLRQGERGRQRLQPLDDQRRRICGRPHAADVSRAAGQAVPAAHAQRERRHPSDPSSPAQFRADACGRAADIRRDEGRGHGRRLPGNGGRFRGG